MIADALPEVLEFEWYEGNKQKNWIKHYVKDEEAEEPFFSEEKVIAEDILHSSEQEARYILIGKTKQVRILFTAYTIRKGKIRIISARDADKKEVSLYEKAISVTEV